MSNTGTKGNPLDLGIAPPPKRAEPTPQENSQKSNTASKPASAKVGNSTNLTKTPSGETVLISFRSTPEFRKELKATALYLDITVTELVHKMFDFWKKNNTK